MRPHYPKNAPLNPNFPIGRVPTFYMALRNAGYHTMSAGVLMVSLSLGLAPIAYRGKAVQEIAWAFILLALGLLTLLRAAALFVGSVLLRSGIDQLLVLHPQRAHLTRVRLAHLHDGADEGAEVVRRALL